MLIGYRPLKPRLGNVWSWVCYARIRIVLAPYKCDVFQLLGFLFGLRGGAPEGIGICLLGILFASPRQVTADGWLSYSTGATDGVSSIWGRTREKTFPELHRLWLFFLPFVVGWMGLFCRYVCGGLERQPGIRFALLARHHKLISCPTLAPTELVYVCTVQVFPSSRMGIAPPPFSFFCIAQILFPLRSAVITPLPPIGGPGCDWDYKLSLCTWPVIPRNIPLFYV